MSKTEKKLTLNDILKNIRLHLNMNQKEFGNLVDADTSYINAIESGRVVISEKRFKKMAELAGYKTKMIIEGRDQRFTFE